MKTMKYLSILFVSLIALSSCEKDESLDPLPLKMNGQMVTIDVKQDRMDFNNVDNTFFAGVLKCPANNVARFEMFVRREVGTDIKNDYVPLLTVTSFPYELRITPQMVADALGVPASTLQNGDFYRFYSYSYDANGVVATYRDLGRNITSERSLKQAYRFRTLLTDNLTDPTFSIYN